MLRNASQSSNRKGFLLHTRTMENGVEGIIAFINVIEISVVVSLNQQKKTR